MSWVVIANLKGVPGDAAALEMFQQIIDSVEALDTKTAAKDAELEAQKVAFSDREAGQYVGQNTPYSHAWADSAGRLGVGLRTDGQELEVPGGIDTTRSGKRVYEGDAYAFAFSDAAGRIGDMCMDAQGRTPDWVLESYEARMGWGSGGGTNPVGTKLAGVALNHADSSTPSTTLNDVNARIPFMLGAEALEWRVHIRNYNDKTATAYAGALNFSGVYVGEHERDSEGLLSGAFKSTPVTVAGAFVSNSAGEEWVSQWMTSNPLEAHKDYLVSYGYSCPAQSNYVASAGGWTTSSATDAALLAPVRTSAKSVPLDVWIEVKVREDTKVVAYIGDSLTLGIQATLPAYDSWPAKHAVANGVIHSVYAIGGSQATDWTDTSARRLSKWSAMASPDAVVLALGNNDIFSYNVDLATMKARTIAVIAMARSFMSDAVYLTTVLPRIGAMPGAQDVWEQFNAWCLQTPGGVRMTYDFAERIANAAGDTDPLWSSTPTNFHLSSAGYARCAATITHALA